METACPSGGSGRGEGHHTVGFWFRPSPGLAARPTEAPDKGSSHDHSAECTTTRRPARFQTPARGAEAHRGRISWTEPDAGWLGTGGKQQPRGPSSLHPRRRLPPKPRPFRALPPGSTLDPVHLFRASAARNCPCALGWTPCPGDPARLPRGVRFVALTASGVPLGAYTTPGPLHTYVCQAGCRPSRPGPSLG